jgi:predicted Zn-ribbon and HTH transcriptional regulator
VAELLTNMQKGDKAAMQVALRRTIKCNSCGHEFVMSTGFSIQKITLFCPKCREWIIRIGSR